MMWKRKRGRVVKRCWKALEEHSRLAGTERGSTLVEFAFVLPLFLLMVMGTIDFGRLAYMYIEVHTAARAGVSYGAQTHITAADNTGMQTAAYNDAADLSTGSPTNFTATASNFCVCSNNNSATSSPQVVCAESSCSGSMLIEYVQVETQASYQPWFPWPGAPTSTTVTATVQLETAQ